MFYIHKSLANSKQLKPKTLDRKMTFERNEKLYKVFASRK